MKSIKWVIQVFSKYHDQVLFFYFNLFFKTESKFKKNIKKISFNNQLGPPFFQLLVSFCLTLTKLGFSAKFLGKFDQIVLMFFSS